jgi:hypothetical protein
MDTSVLEENTDSIFRFIYNFLGRYSTESITELFTAVENSNLVSVINLWLDKDLEN